MTRITKYVGKQNLSVEKLFLDREVLFSFDMELVTTNCNEDGKWAAEFFI